MILTVLCEAFVTSRAEEENSARKPSNPQYRDIFLRFLPACNVQKDGLDEREAA